MAQTKKKRRSKHRGTAAGTIEARGRTGRKPTAEEGKQDSRARREERMSRAPTWKSSFTRAGFATLLLFVFTQIGLLGDRVPIGTAVGICVLAMVIYVPLGYATDNFLYKRRMAKQAGQGRPKR